VRIGVGPEPLVVLPGMALDSTVPSGLVVAAYTHGFRALLARHTVYVVQRPRGMASGASTRDIAAEYGSLLAAELGRFRLLGLSTGGLVAQHLALDHPNTVERLALVVTGARIAARGRDLCTRWLEYAGAERWRDLRGSLGASAVDGAVAQWLARALLGGTGRTPSGQELADFRTTVAAALAHDTRHRLPDMRVPALLLGGARDPFFPAETLRETADLLPDVVLKIFPRRGHGVPKHCAGAVQETLSDFFGRP
jgi:pimeloyl-ACP methyl ester carboxylesterase